MLNDERFVIGTDVVCRDGPCGELRRIVIDPAARILTHLAVDPERGRGVGRLVPVGLVQSSNGEIRLACSRKEFDQLDPAEETQFLPGPHDYLDYNVDEIVAWPYFNWAGGVNMRAPTMGVPVHGSEVTTYESVPLGEVAIQRGDRVEASDGEIGRVKGLVVNPASHGVTHVLLQEGHLWGRKEVAIPITVVDAIDGGIAVRMTKEEVADLPPVDLETAGE